MHCSKHKILDFANTQLMHLLLSLILLDNEILHLQVLVTTIKKSVPAILGLSSTALQPNNDKGGVEQVPKR